MAGSLSSMTNIGRIAKIVALLLFLMPWVTVSCSPQALGSMSGAPPGAMAGTGDVVLIKATGAELATGTATPANPSTAPNSSNPFAKPNFPILVAALVILLSLGLTFLGKGAKGLLGAAAGCGLAIALLCYAVLVDIPAAMQTAPTGGSLGPGAPPIDPAELARMIQVKTEIGFWLTILALAAAVVLNILGMKSAAPAAAASAPPPPA